MKLFKLFMMAIHIGFPIVTIIHIWDWLRWDSINIFYSLIIISALILLSLDWLGKDLEDLN